MRHINRNSQSSMLSDCISLGCSRPMADKEQPCQLPPDILRLLFQHMELLDLAQLMLVSKSFHAVATEPQLWQQRCVALRLPTDIPPSYAVHVKVERFAKQSFLNYLHVLDLQQQQHVPSCSSGPCLTPMEPKHKYSAGCVQQWHSPQSLDVSHSDFDHLNLHFLVNHATSLTSLNISYNDLGGGLSLPFGSITHWDMPANVPTSPDQRPTPTREHVFEVLSQLVHLHTLKAVHVHLNDAGVIALSSLQGLTSLDVSMNEFSSSVFPHLAALSNLSELYLNNCPRLTSVPALGPLLELTKVSTLHMRGVCLQGTGLQQLSKMVRLVDLQVGGNSQHDVTSIQALTSLTALGWENFPRAVGRDSGLLDPMDSGLCSLVGLAGLQRLSLPNLDVPNLQCLAQLSSLEFLDAGLILTKDMFCMLQHLSLLTGLRTLLLSLHQFTGDSDEVYPRLPLYCLTDLRHLAIEYSFSTTVNVPKNEHQLSALTQLTSLTLKGDTPMHSLAPLTALANLKELVVCNMLQRWRGLSTIGNSLSAISTLSVLTELTSLEFQCCGLQDEHAQGLSLLTQLCSLNVSINCLTSASARYIVMLTRLHTLHVANTEFDQQGLQKLWDGLPKLRSFWLDKDACQMMWSVCYGRHTPEFDGYFQSLDFDQPQGNVCISKRVRTRIRPVGGWERVAPGWHLLGNWSKRIVDMVYRKMSGASHDSNDDDGDTDASIAAAAADWFVDSFEAMRNRWPVRNSRGITL